MGGGEIKADEIQSANLRSFSIKARQQQIMP
jgi:hypothetical protein